jgi:hypothetical protein
VSDQGFAEETKFVFSEFSVGDGRGRFIAEEDISV